MTKPMTLSVLLLAAVACSGGTRTLDLPAITASAPPRSMAASQARIEIVEPKEGDVIAPDQATVVVRVSGFELVEPGEGSRAGQGHVVFYAGTGYSLPVEPHRAATSGGSGVFVSFVASTTRYTWSAPAAGPQTFAAQLVSEGDLPLVPPRWDAVNVTVATE